MSFLFPTFLIGLLAIAIPIIIHLFNFRKYKKVYFTNVQFLKEIKQESDSKSKLKEWLILALRILAVMCLVIAFAQPFITSKNKIAQGQKSISIYIDNSFSMEGTNKKGTLLENAKQYAKEVANTYKASDKFQLLTNDFEGKHQRFISKEDFIEQLNSVRISSATKTLTNVLKRQQDFLQNTASNDKRIFILSDFQKHNSSFVKSFIDTSVSIGLIPIASSEINNVFIDSVWFETPIQQIGTKQTLHAIIINKSEKGIENGTLKLFINNAQVSLSSFNSDANTKKEVIISFTLKTKGVNKGILKIEDYPITYDDTFYISFNAQTSINTLVINGKETKTADSFRSLMQNDSLFVYQENNESSVDYSAFVKANTIILNELSTLSSGFVTELQKFVTNGGSVVVFPSDKLDINSYNSAFKNLQLPQINTIDTMLTNTRAIDFEQGLYQGVFDKVDQQMDLPKVYKHIKFAAVSNTKSQNSIILQNGDPLLSLTSLGKGKIYLFSVASNKTSSNLLQHSLFVPSIIKMAILSLKSTPLYYKTSINEYIELQTNADFNDKPLHIIKDDKTLDIIPEHRLVNNTTTLFTQNQITEAGHYNITENGIPVKALAFNFDRRESDLSFITKEELQKQLDENGIKTLKIIDANEANVSISIESLDDTKQLWKLFLVLALFFLLAEIIVIRLLK